MSQRRGGRGRGRARGRGSGPADDRLTTKKPGRQHQQQQQASPQLDPQSSSEDTRPRRNAPASAHSLSSCSTTSSSLPPSPRIDPLDSPPPGNLAQYSVGAEIRPPAQDLPSVQARPSHHPAERSVQPEVRPTQASFQPTSQGPVQKQPVQPSPQQGRRASNGSQQRPQNIHGLKQPPDRPGYGTQGRQIEVRANFFPIRFPEHMTIYHYDVTISPEKISKNHCRKVFEQFQRQHLNVIGAFDGSKSCYFAKLPYKELSMKRSVQLRLERNEDPKEFTVVLQRAKDFAFNIDVQRIQDIFRDASECMPMIQALDVILRHLPSLRMEPIGRSFFTKPEQPFLLGAGKEVWNGYYQSVRPTMGWKVMLNVDTAATAFYTEQPVFDFMCMTLKKGSSSDLSEADKREFRGRELTDYERKRFSREIKGLKIVVSHLPYPRKYKVNDLTLNSVRKQTFPRQDGSMCSVENYFKEVYPDHPIKNPLLPCLHVGQKSRNIYLPMDVCSIVGGQRCIKKLTDKQAANMIRHTASPAYQRERAIKETVKNADFRRDAVAREFGIQVSDRMVEIPGRVLSPPTLRYSHSQNVTPDEGRGCWDMGRGTKFYEGIRVSNWVVVVCAGRCNCQRFVDELMKISTNMGMVMEHPKEIVQLGGQRIEVVFERLRKRHGALDLILAIIDRRESHYDDVKRLGDTKDGMGVATQCVLSDTVEKKCNRATISNICLKINARLGGVNSIVNLSSRILCEGQVIIFGADVTHPRSGDTTSPSIASVVASVDLQGSRYRALHRNQKHRQEIIADLKDMAKEHLIEFRRFTKCKPGKIIFYRDGVSEGQFESVRQEEISALQGTCLDLQPDGSYQPKITFIVVQKRHHTRFFPKSRDDGGKGGNVPPGTTVDSVITHHTEHDFYLCSHAAIQGTSRPCHYHVLWDDSDFSADDLQTLSYQLCHMFWRCNRSVSYPAPTYYAHRDAAHARMLLRAHEDYSSSGGSHSGEQSMSKEDMNNAIEIHEERKNKMYFM